MSRDAITYLHDMVEHAKLAQVFVQGVSADEFERDFKTRHAVINVLTVIGEAAGKLPKEFRSQFPQVPWARIIGMRNVLAHDYQGTRPRAVYDTAVTSVPELLAQLEAIIAALPDGGAA